MIYRFLLSCAAALALAASAEATVYASNGSASDVADKIAGCADDFTDEVTIPPGEFSWPSAVLFNKAVTLRGAGVGSTIIYNDNLNTGSSTSPLVLLETSASKSYRMTGIEFRGRYGQCTGDAATNVITSTAHGLAVNQRIIFFGSRSNGSSSANFTLDATPLAGGAGISAWSTSATEYYVKTVPTANTFTISTSSGGAELNFTTDITAGTWRRETNSDTQYGVFQVSGLSQSLRIDHCKFHNLKADGYFRWINTIGVIDNCTFTMDSGSYRAILLEDSGLIGSDDTYGDGSWTSAVDWNGNRGGVTIESCTLTKNILHMNQSYGASDTIFGGGRLISRFNTLSGTRWGNHGTETSQRPRGGRFMESFGDTTDFSMITAGGAQHTGYDYRSGTPMVFFATMIGDIDDRLKLNSYRALGGMPPWGQADGTKAWDTNDISDTFGTAADGIFETGTISSAGVSTISDTDSGKAWGTTQWIGSTVRLYANLTAGAGTVSGVSIDIAGSGWTTDMFDGCEITKTQGGTVFTGAKGAVSGNDSDTLTLDSSYHRPAIASGDTFQISFSGLVGSHTANVFTLQAGPSGSFNFSTCGLTSYEVRKVKGCLDDPGMGTTAALSGGTPYNHQSLSQTWNDPGYVFGSVWKITSGGGETKLNVDSYYSVQQVENRNWFCEVDNFATFDGSVGIGSGTAAQMAAETPTTAGVGYWVTDEADWNSTVGGADGQMYQWNGSAWVAYYVPYNYPHPLTITLGDGADVTAPTLSTVSVNGSTVTWGFSESVSNFNIANWAFSTGSLSAQSGSGSSYSATLTAAATFGGSYTTSYTPGTTQDAATNALASISARAVTNNTPDPGGGSATRNPGRIRGRGKLLGR